MNANITVADPDLELRGGVVLLALSAFLPSVISSFLPKIRWGGGDSPGPSAKSATDNVPRYG